MTDAMALTSQAQHCSSYAYDPAQQQPQHHVRPDPSWHQTNPNFDSISYHTEWSSAMYSPSSSNGVYACEVFPSSYDSSMYSKSSQRTDPAQTMYRFPSLEVSDTCYAPTLTGSPPSQPDSPRWEKRLSSADAAPAFDDGEREPAAFHVKAEPDETAGAFILERGTESLLPQIPCLTPITAPLRATHASKDMRKLMGVFRLDPFTVHNGVRGSPRAWQYGAEEEPGPLAEEPVMFEFQLELVHALDSPTPPESRSPTPASLKEEEPRCSAYRSSYFPAYAEPAKMDYDAHLLENMNPTAGVFATDGCLQAHVPLHPSPYYEGYSPEEEASFPADVPAQLQSAHFPDPSALPTYYGYADPAELHVEYTHAPAYAARECWLPQGGGVPR